jgi:hypothetical protein
MAHSLVAASPLIAEDKFFGVGSEYDVDSFIADWENLPPLTAFEDSLFPMNPMSDDWPWLNSGDAPDSSEIVSSSTSADEGASGIFDQLLSEGTEASNLDVPMEPIFTEAVVDPVDDDFTPTDDEETVVVIHYHDEDSEEEAPTTRAPAPQPPVRRTKTRRGRKKPQANAWSMQRRTVAPGESKKAAAPVNAELANLKKLYEHTPFKNADLERCRRNAVNAKINRDRKKAQLDEMVAEMKKLREENERLRRQMEAQAQQNNQAQSELRQMADLIRTGGGDFSAVLKLAASLGKA